MSLIHLMTMGAGTPVRESVNLTGTSGSPNFRFYEALQPDIAVVDFVVATTDSAPTSREGSAVNVAEYDEGDLPAYDTIAPWVTPKAFTGTYFIKATLIDGVTPDSIASAGIGVWYPLTTNRTWGWQTGGSLIKKGTIKLEIADSDSPDEDSNIVTEGYYRGWVQATP